MATTPPALGYGTRGEAPIDSVNQWMRGTSWYQSLIRSFGQQPNNVRLSDNQKQQVIRAAQANGVVVDEGGDGQEIDESGNFRAKGHTLRNTLIVAGIAAAALATAGAAGVFGGAAAAGAGGVEAGATAGLGAAASSGAALGGMATLPALSTAAATTAISAAASTVGPTVAKKTAEEIAKKGGAVTLENILKYAVPTVGGLIGSVVESNAQSASQAAQQKYLDEALAYAKEQDTYNRNRQTGLDAQEVQRYGDYQGRIKGFIDNGQNSNDRMSALLGLAPRANVGSSAPGSRSSGPPASQRGPLDAATQAAIRSELQRTNSSDSPAAWDEYVSSHGDSSVKNWDYWKGRIDTGDGVGKGYAGGSSAPPVAPSSAPPVSTQPQARAADVQMRAPDGSVKTVPADQVAHYRSLGATLLGAAA